MHSAILTFLAMTAAGPAVASSIETLSTIPLAHPKSVMTIECPTCPKAHRPMRDPDYTVPTLANGEQRFEIGERGGKPALMRTEAWMGGSPVTFVSLNPIFVEGEQKAIAKGNGTVPVSPSRGDGVDLQATTSAVANEPPVTPASTAGAAATAPDFSTFELRPSH